MKLTATIIHITDEDDEMVRNLCSIAITRGIGYIYRPTLTNTSHDTLTMFTNSEGFEKLIEECQMFQNFSNEQEEKILMYFIDNAEEIELDLSASYVPTQPTKLF